MRKTVHSNTHMVSMYDRISITTGALLMGLAVTWGLVGFHDTVVSDAGRLSVKVAISVMFVGTVFNSLATLFGRRDSKIAKLKQQLRTFLNIA